MPKKTTNNSTKVIGIVEPHPALTVLKTNLAGINNNKKVPTPSLMMKKTSSKKRNRAEFEASNKDTDAIIATDADGKEKLIPNEIP